MDNKNTISSGLLELYLMGLTTSDETEQVENLLVNNPDLRYELDQIQNALEGYAQANAIKPDENIKQKIFAQIKSGESLPVKKLAFTSGKVLRLPSFMKYAIAASIILLIGSIVLNIVMYDKYHTADNQLGLAKEEINTLQTNNSDLSREMNVYQSKYSEPISLHGLAPAPNANAKVIWMKNSGEVYLDPSNLPETPAGKQYQLWAIVDGKPVSAGMVVLTHDGKTAHVQKMKTIGKVQAFAVTLEDEKDNPTPKGPMYAMGKMQ